MVIRMNLDKIAKEISYLDFRGVDPDNTDEACYNLARDLYDASDDEAEQIVKIIMDKYVQNIDGY